MSLENPLWGRAKIRDALAELGYRRLDVGGDSQVHEKVSKGPVRNVEGVFEKSFECGVGDGLLCGSKRRIQGVVCIRDP